MLLGLKKWGILLLSFLRANSLLLVIKKQLDIPFFLGKEVETAGSFGAGVLVNTTEAGTVNPDGYVYIYGVRGKNKEVMVARVLPENIEAFDQWTFGMEMAGAMMFRR